MFFRDDVSGSAADVLRRAADLYESKTAEYGNSFILVGRVMSALFPNGIELKTEEDFRRHHLLEWSVGKLVRYCQLWEKGGHVDSIEDEIVYLAMLAFEDRVKSGG